ncbi:hypothetical protein G7070_10195 [Propioniciclava coleopterorum]|uniref:AEC family transporter n=1 Tax=Propioniciclava coleopterorum TaxID=2714937 RepID=A0A6G7Y704_9ACTN|nr:AEC family transporter [Propioniciclava coleopterorum]QIK72570.1 hypothetical protein G7070_10195 [Propioniciclava coleopterorum]
MDLVLKAATLVAIIALGYLVKRLGWLQGADFRVLSTIALRITLPCALIVGFDKFEIQPSLLWLSLFAFVTVVAGQVISWVVERRWGLRAQAFGVLNVSSFNIGLFVIPYLGAFLGPEAIVIASMFDVGNALSAAGVGYAWGLGLAAGRKPSILKFLNTLLHSPVFMTYLVLLLLGLFRIHLPGPVLGFAATVGAANTFIAMFMIGIGLEIVLDRRSYVVAARYLATRYAVVALAAIALWVLVPFSHMEKVVLTAVLVAPMAAMSSGFTAEADLDVSVSTFMTTFTVLVAIVAMPALLLALG